MLLLLRNKLLLALVIAPKIIFSQIQNNTDNETIIERIEFLANDENQNLEDYSEIYDELEFYLQHPINVNLQSDILKDLGLINNSQLKSIKRYIANNGEIVLLYELQAIENLTKETILRIAPFIEFSGNRSIRPISYTPVKSSLIIRSQSFLEKQKGFKNDRPFMGSRSKNYMRLRVGLNRKWSIGLAMENDIGEAFRFSNSYYLLDHHSFYLKKSFSENSALILGDYQVNFGQGLVSWTGAGRAKSSDVLQIKKVGRKIRESASSNETNYLRGLAFNGKTRRLEYAVYYSRKLIDVKIDEDQQTIKSYPSSGYHRTSAELSSRKKGMQENLGGTLSLNFKKVEIGSTFATQQKSKLPSIEKSTILAPSSLELQKYHSSAYFDLHTSLINFFGELAFDEKRNSYYAGGLLIALNKTLSLALQYRNSKSAEDNEQSTAFSESGKSGNERGVYSGIEWDAGEHTKFSFYRDLFEFPKSKYQVTGPSTGHEILLQVESEITKTIALIIRFKTEVKEKDHKVMNSEIKSIGEVVKKGFRIELRNEINEQVRLKSRIETTNYQLSNQPAEKGILIFQDFKWRSEKNKTGIDLRFSTFRTSSFNSRIYAYENDVLFAFSIPSYSGRGIHNYIMFQQKLSRNMKVWVRYARTTYFDRYKISSGLTEIEGNVKSELKFQLKVSF